MPMRLLRATCLALLCLAAAGPAIAAPPSWSEVQARAQPAPGLGIAYGRSPSQFGELRIPGGPGRHPVVVLIHGNCWQRSYDLRYFSHLAEALTREAGVATWNLEYRRLGEPGAGWPATLRDVAEGADHLRELAPAYRLDLDRVISLGHSAGGQLALWLGSRSRLSASSALYRPRPLALHGAVALAPITDLVAYGEGNGSCNASVDDLLGGSPQRQLSRYSQASPRALLPLGIPQWLIQGLLDPIVPAASVRAYAEAARQSGDAVQLEIVEQAGHFDAVLPDSATWPAVLAAVRAALGLTDGRTAP